MKKTTIFALVAVLVLVAASGALAWGGRGGRGMALPGGADGAAAPRMMRGMASQDSADGATAPVMRRGMAGRGSRSCFAAPGATRGMRSSRMMKGGTAGRGTMSVWANVEIPQEIQDKQAEMQKLSVEMRAEMQKNPVDRAKVEELHKKRFELRDALSNWRMQQRLDMIEKLQK
jgi:hypothetical protein